MTESTIDLRGLNTEQKKAVLHTEGPLLILAGAGTGKTRVITYRAAHLIYDKGLPAYRLLAITFTNKAANEMKQRIDAITDGAAHDAWISTFHSMCCRILRRDIEKIGYDRSFSIYDDKDQIKVLNDILKEKQLSEKLYSARDIKSRISDAKNRLLSVDGYIESVMAGDFRAENIMSVMKEYERRLMLNNALDFDDLLVKTVELFEKCPDVLSYYQNRFQYIMVDEYQDTNYAQYRIVALMAALYKNICVVGDDDQSIYGWRGADIHNILDFENEFEDTYVIKLEQNYRSTKNILEAANAVIANNFERKSKRLWTRGEEGDKISVERLGNEKDEAIFIAQEIGRACREDKAYSDFAVLYRYNAQSRAIEEAFSRFGIRYRVYGANRFFDRKEIRDILAYLKIVVNPADGEAIERIINVPRRGIGETTIQTLRSMVSEEESLLEVVLDAAENHAITARARARLAEFSVLLTKLSAYAETDKPADFIRRLIDNTGLRSQYETAQDEDDLDRMRNIDEFIGSAEQFFADNPDASIGDYVENVSLSVDTDDDEDEYNRVTVMTIHAAKGLEFDTVFLAGAENGIFPSNSALFDEKEMQEERRLCYVAVTRAKRKLYITSCQGRMLFGHGMNNEPSQFIREMPPDVCGSLTMQRSGRAQVRTAAYSAPRKKVALADTATVTTAREERKADDDKRYAVGDRVKHNKYGEGIVMATEEGTNGQTVTVIFNGQPLKKFSAALAPMVKL
ncbi:MAG: UvrD-helicase domain-containing protein [Eubacteriales bacterium]|nr:UvrD-helicase domain-containing protein [Eubacteriales bacterium]